MAADRIVARFPLILLAGGRSSRVGSPKGLIEIDGRPWVELQCEAFRNAGGSEIILVLGYDIEPYRKLLLEGVERVINPDPANGPFTSIQAGARRVLELKRDGAFVLPIDVPAPAAQVWESLATELTGGVQVCQPTFEREGRARGGHPVLLSARELEELVRMRPNDRLDRRIHQLDPGALRRVAVSDERVLKNLNAPEDWDLLERASPTVREIGKGAAILSMVEVGLGSVLHAFHVPTAGHWLSLNQSFWLSRANFALRAEPDARFAPMTLSNVTASLKSLSPAGKKLTPMLAISVQGVLFNSGTLILGRGFIGASLGAVLSSFWGFLQPLIVYYFIFGHTLVQALRVFLDKSERVFHFTDHQALGVLIAVVAMKALLAIVVVAMARFIPQATVDEYQRKLIEAGRRARPKAFQSNIPTTRRASVAAKGALRDLLHPLFLISLALTVIFFFWAASATTQLVWLLLRPLALGFIVFFAIRIAPVERIESWVERRGFVRFAAALRIAKGAVMRERR